MWHSPTERDRSAFSKTNGAGNRVIAVARVPDLTDEEADGGPRRLAQDRNLKPTNQINALNREP